MKASLAVSSAPLRHEPVLRVSLFYVKKTSWLHWLHFNFLLPQHKSEKMVNVIDLIYLGAVIVIAWLLLKIAKGLWTCWIANALGLGYDWKSMAKNDSWAVITGASDGIGLEYSKQLAAKGLNVLLIARNEEKLKEAAEKVKSKAKPDKKVEYFVVDFSSSTVYDKIKDKLANLPHIGVLVNNVGISYTTPEYYTQIPVTNGEGFLEKLININIISVTRMTEIVLPRMESQKQGVIINISSISGAYPTPLLSVYGASKGFVDLLSRAVHKEYQDKKIIVQSVLPSYVSTKMSKIRKASFLVPTASDYVSSALKTVGIESRTYGYWTHKLQGFVQDHMINGIAGPSAMENIAMNSLKGINKAYYRKYVNKKDS